MMYRITFTGDNASKHYDVEAASSSEAFRIAYRYPEAQKRWLYTNVWVSEIPDGPKDIGIEFEYEQFKKTYYQYIVIRANNEASAIKYYNENIKGMRFYQPWPHKPDENGNCVYGAVHDTYYACGPNGYHFDAT